MMDITKLTDQEKSVMLARAMGWKKVNDKFYMEPHSRGFPDKFWDEAHMNFYRPANMALAKRAILWGYVNEKEFRKWLRKYALAILIEDGGFGRALDKLCLYVRAESV
jgi:hypothetical protein